MILCTAIYGTEAGLPVIRFSTNWGSLIPHTRCRLYGVVHSICKQSGLYCTIRPLLVGSKCPSKFVICFVALHAPQCGEWIVEIRETRGQKLLCVFGRVGYCWSLPNKIMLPQVFGNSCYSHRVAEQLGNPMSCRWSDLYLPLIVELPMQKPPPKATIMSSLRRYHLPLGIATAIISIMTNFLPLFYPRNARPKLQPTQPSERFDVFFICLQNSV